MTIDFSPYEAGRVFRHCPKCGSDRFEFDEVKRFDCQTCGFVYYVNACGTVVGVIRAQERRIVFTVREHEPAAGTLDLPGGFIDQRETAEDALRREIWEELNLHVTKFQFVCSMPNRYVFKDLLYHTIDFFFLCDVSNFHEIQSREEVSGFRLMTLEEIKIEDIGFESIRRGIAFLRGAVERGEIVV